ncbi:hypothetical protein QVD17_14822 [Tagetes erecta]|uniref:EF-hand domain-containing protein n=1 Tax=Tagetes erecta TaxID=13708 RepID=A0AAD8NY59_TARER|nr:hypothetical protein QVD17_14822 [Tagetes erecta]
MAFPRIVLVIVGGIASTELAAQNQVTFGVSMYAGTTLITLTLVWGLSIILNQERLPRKPETAPVQQHHDESSTKCLPLINHKLAILKDNGVNVNYKWKREIVVMMLLSLIPFAAVELVVLIKSPLTILFALIVSIVLLVSYFAYQIWNPWIQDKSLAYLKEDNLRIWFFYHIERLVEGKLVDEHGIPKRDALESIFIIADTDKDGHISHKELESLIEDQLQLKKKHISTEYAKEEILKQFDDNESGFINLLEFQDGCTKWLKKWKDDEYSSNSVPKNIWAQVTKAAIENERENLTQTEQIMPRILNQVNKKYGLLKENGDVDREKIKELFSRYKSSGGNAINRSELQEFIKTLDFGVSLDHDKIFNKLAKDFDVDKSHDTIEENEFVEGFVKWIDIAINHDPTIKDPNVAIAKFEEDWWAEIDTPINMVIPKRRIFYVIFGVPIMSLISRALTQSVMQFSNAAHIPLNLTSFVVLPFVMNAKIVIKPFLHAGPRVSRNASLTFSQIYNGLVMNNLLGLLTLLAIVYAKGLSWTYSAEVLTIMLPCVVVGIFALKCNTYPLWVSIFAMLLYPIYVYFYCIFGS